MGAGGQKARTQNMPYMFVTREVSKERGWLNVRASLNIPSMVVTLEVSQGSGWLNFVYCRRPQASRSTQAVDPGGGRRRGRPRQVSVWARLQIVGTGHGKKHTANMPLMSVTREVSQLEMSALKLPKL